MTDLIGIILVFSVIALMLYRIIKVEMLKKKAIDSMWEDDHAMDEIIEEDYNGSDLHIREEERAVWNGLTRKQKRWIMNEQRKKLKSGQYVKTEDGKLITRAEAKKHGLI